MSYSNILTEKEKEIINKCNKLTGKKIQSLIFRGIKIDLYQKIQN